MCELMMNKDIYSESIFDHIMGKNEAHKIREFFGFFEFSGFQLKLWDLYRSRRNDSDGWFFTWNTTFQALQDRIPFGGFVDTYGFFWEKLHGIGP